MRWQDLLVDGFGRIAELLEKALAGLTQEDLDWQPRPDCNSMGWITWHLTRVQDSHIADLMHEPQMWLGNEWHIRFNRLADPDDTGFGHTDANVKAFKSPPVETLLGYYKAVQDKTTKYLDTLSLADLDRELNEPSYQPLPTVGVRLVSVLSDGLVHAGETAYVRGLRKGKGWSE